MITRIQLLDNKDNKGFLDVKDNVSVPLNFSISDIRDVGSRSGMFSKTIRLAGSDNNNLLLNNYFDVNVVAGTFDVNKKQRVAIVQNGIIIKDNCYMRLMKVVKKQYVSMDIDNYVEYEVQIVDELGDFFKDIGNKELKELNAWDKYNHLYNISNIADSWSHTSADGYKYVLPHTHLYEYDISELLPGVYAKTIFDMIHTTEGFTYQWDDLASDNVQFDKSILPYAGDKKKLTEEYIQRNNVIVDNLNIQSSPKVIISDGAITNTTNFPVIDNEVKDPNNQYDDSISVYNNTQQISSPNSLNYNIIIDYDLVLVNDDAFVIELKGKNQKLEAFVRIFDSSTNTEKGTKILNINHNQSISDVQNFSNTRSLTIISQTNNGVYEWKPGEHIIGSGTQEFNLPITTLNGADNIKVGVGAKASDASLSIWKRVGSSVDGNMKVKVVVKSITVEISISADSPLVPGSIMNLRDFLPNKMKQSDFLKSIYQKYNLYVEMDENDPTKLIYTSRDKFYDEGEIKDWTKKLDKKKDQELLFIPDITSKSIILTYKDDDKDYTLSAYKDETSETFGQQKVTFDNENIKGEDRQEESFSPTINMETDFRAVLPILPADFKMNARFLQDGGILPCGSFTLIESDNVWASYTTYPHISMYDRPYNPRFSIEYGPSRYVAYNIGTATKNTLYSNHWRRTLAQINSGKMLKAYFHLTESDIQSLRMSDKIKLNNAYYYINAILDYDANSHSTTKVELLTVEDDLILPSIGRDAKVDESIKDLDRVIANTGTVKPTRPGGFFKEAISKEIDKRVIGSVVTTGPVSVKGVMGMNNILPKDFSGIIIGDDIIAEEDGMYVGDDTKLIDVSLTMKEINFFEDGMEKISFGEYVEDDYVDPGYVEDNQRTRVTMNDGEILMEANDILTFDIPHIDFGNATIVGWSGPGGGSSTSISNGPGSVNIDASGNVDITTPILDLSGAGSVVGLPGIGIIDILYVDLVVLKSNSLLVVGSWYHITDRDIWLLALSDNELSMSGKRRFAIVKDIHYTPNGGFLGIYGQTFAKGSVPNSGSYYNAIWGGRVWRRLLSGADVPGTSDEIIAGGWTMMPITDTTYYENKIFDIKYNFDDDIIWEQSDDRGNIIKRYGSLDNSIDITDWGNTDIYNNENSGIFNNYRGTSKANIRDNSNNGNIRGNSKNGMIWTNSNNGFIHNNSNIGDIRDNSNNGGISTNSNNGGIIYNSNSGHIRINSNGGLIDNNSNPGDIRYNSNNGRISTNSNGGTIDTNSNNGSIQSNSNNGFIENNSNNGRISNNSNLGTIWTNSSSGSTTFTIRDNMNNGSIQRNNSIGNTLIQNNINNGNIGPSTGTTNRSGTISDVVVNK